MAQHMEEHWDPTGDWCK